MKIAVVHDLAESLVGDIVPHDTRYSKEQKRAMEEVTYAVVGTCAVLHDDGVNLCFFGACPYRKPSGILQRTWIIKT